MPVSQFFWGTINDKTIARLDPLFHCFRRGDGILRRVEWRRLKSDGAVVMEQGAYMVSDGGYHEWACLACPYKHQLEGTDEFKWSKNVESVRKDVECVFGIMKKRFLILKHPIRLHNSQHVERVFVTCGVIHNMLMDHNGLDDVEEDEVNVRYNVLDRYNAQVHGAERRRRGIREEDMVVAGVRSGNRHMYGVAANAEQEDYVNDETEKSKYAQRRQGLIEHYTCLRRMRRRGQGA